MLVPYCEIGYDPRTWDWSLLRAGETFWIGPIPLDQRKRELSAARDRAKRLVRQGLPIFVKLTEKYLCVRHLTVGKPKKLSEWYGLAVGQSILINPDPSADEVELGLGTSMYLRYLKKLIFEVEVRDGGELWVARLS